MANPDTLDSREIEDSLAESFLDENERLPVLEKPERTVSRNGACIQARSGRVSTARRPPLVDASKAEKMFPELVADRPFILTAFRVNFTARECLESWLYAHNESGNIWTHLCAAAVAAAVLLALCLAGASPFPDCHLTNAEALIVGAYVAGAAACLGASTVYHTFCCSSRRAFYCCKRLDHAGVLCLLGASDIPMVYFGFYSRPRLQAAYLCLVAAALAGAGGAILSPGRSCRRHDAFRHAMFVALVLVGWTHMAHDFALKGGLSTPEGRETLRCWATSFGPYALGFVFFVTKLPERLRPGAFDVWGHSHQLWHALIIAGAARHFFNILQYARIAKGLPLA
mmetsp:Transcript_33835/g.80318  ORF Transcript_33835/g.80318 Transcript_33835/m.80318 type:complete len:341 (-) Transcript_33835:79-1101(-)